MTTRKTNRLFSSAVLLILIICFHYATTAESIRNVQMAKQNLEENLEVMPQWLQDYISWHSDQRKHHLNDPSTKFLIVACHSHSRCGGLSTRLTSIPYFIEIANRMRRVLFIKWQKYNLEDFLLPMDADTFDWRLPDGIDIGGDVDAKNTVQSMEIEKLIDNPNHPLNKKRNLVVRTNTNVQSFLMQRRLADEGSYSNLMDILFQPVPELAREITNAMNSMGIKRKQYVAAHYRALADQDIEINKDSKAEMHRAIDCVVKAVGDKSVPIYFASSRGNIVKYILGDSPYAQSKKPAVKVIGLDYGTRIHSDKTGVGFDNPRDLYPAFVDMWLLKSSKCVSYGHLGFGRFGRYLSGEECGINYIFDKNCPSVLR